MDMSHQQMGSQNPTTSSPWLLPRELLRVCIYAREAHNKSFMNDAPVTIPGPGTTWPPLSQSLPARSLNSLSMSCSTVSA
eukprot:4393012-Amphidinium_carterae.1